VGEEIFGRAEQLALMAAFVDRTSTRPRALVFAGDAGIGKSVLWNWGTEAAARLGWRVLSCRPGERESSLSYAALGDLLAEAVDEVGRDLPEPQRRAMDVALLRRAAMDRAIDRRAIAVAALAIIKLIVRRQPVLIAVDDANWLDKPTSRVLEFAARRLGSEDVGLLLTVRATEGASPPIGLDRALPADEIQQIRLQPLSLGVIYHVVRSRLGAGFPRTVMVELHRASGGNPFFALEIARGLLTGGFDSASAVRLPIPATLTESIETRLAALPTRIRNLMLVIAALSHPTISLIRGAAERPDSLESDLDRATRDGLIQVDGERIRFAHPLLASVTYNSAPDLRRRNVHQRLAAVVTDLEERASHLARSADEPDAEIAGMLDLAAARARGRGAVESAASLWEEARKLTPPDDGHTALRRAGEAAMCHYLGGEVERARELWEEIVSAAPAGPVRAAATWHLVEFRHAGLDAAQQVVAGEKALADAVGDPALCAQIHHTLALTLVWAGELAEARPHAKAALELAEHQGDRAVLAMALTAVAWVEHLSGRGVSPELADRWLRLEDAVLDLPLENNPALLWASMVADIGEDPKLARGVFARMRRLAEDSGYEVSLPFLLYQMSELERRTGDWALAARYAEECEAVARQTDQTFRVRLALCAKAMIASCRGEADTARALAREGLALAGPSGPWIVDARLQAALGFLELSLGHAEKAHAWLSPLAARARPGGSQEPTAVRCLPDEIEALIEMDELEAAETFLERLEEQGRKGRRAWALATAGRCRGELAAARGDLGAARRALEGALLEHERLSDPLELARTLQVLGNVCRRTRQKRSAREYLGRAVASFDQLGAALWSARARKDLARVSPGASSRRQLSATEQRVAMLVREGRTNKEIARTLFVSVKAIEANLTRIYSKLGVRSRTQLAPQVRPAESDEGSSSAGI
jgi:ATP/maltotriose-dependent transcriptional regulator MalT